MQILDSSFDGGLENVTKWHPHSPPGLIIGSFCTIFRADPFIGVLGPSLAGKRPKTDQNLNLYFSFLVRPLVLASVPFCTSPSCLVSGPRVRVARSRVPVHPSDHHPPFLSSKNMNTHYRRLKFYHPTTTRLGANYYHPSCHPKINTHITK